MRVIWPAEMHVFTRDGGENVGSKRITIKEPSSSVSYGNLTPRRRKTKANKALGGNHLDLALGSFSTAGPRASCIK